jgi:hypothetical protein
MRLPLDRLPRPLHHRLRATETVSTIGITTESMTMDETTSESIVAQIIATANMAVITIVTVTMTVTATAIDIVTAVEQGEEEGDPRYLHARDRGHRRDLCHVRPRRRKRITSVDPATITSSNSTSVTAAEERDRERAGLLFNRAQKERPAPQACEAELPAVAADP